MPFDDASLLQVDPPDDGGRGRDGGGLRPGAAHARRRRLTYAIDATPKPSLVIIVKPLEEVPERLAREGIVISLVDILRNHPGSVNPIIKSNNLLNNALAMQAAYRRGGEETLMCNFRGELSECSQSNFFMVRGGAAITPASDAGLLEGVTRAFLFEVGREVGVDVRAQNAYPANLRPPTKRSSRARPASSARWSHRRSADRKRHAGTDRAQTTRRLSAQGAGVTRAVVRSA